MATWFVIVGLVLLLTGFELRTVQMMQASDATAARGQALYGRDLIRLYGVRFPGSPMPLLMRVSLVAGLLLLAAGIGYELMH